MSSTDHMTDLLPHSHLQPRFLTTLFNPWAPPQRHLSLPATLPWSPRRPPSLASPLTPEIWHPRADRAKLRLREQRHWPA